MIKAAGNERCSRCGRRVIRGDVMLEGDGGDLFCSSDCMAEHDAEQERDQLATDKETNHA